MILGAAGAALMGAGYDHFHSYAMPLAIFCGGMLLALVLLIRLGPYEYGVEPEPIPLIEPAELPSEAQD